MNLAEEGFIHASAEEFIGIDAAFDGGIDGDDVVVREFLDVTLSDGAEDFEEEGFGGEGGGVGSEGFADCVLQGDDGGGP